MQKIWKGRVYTLLYYIWQYLAFKPWEDEAIEGNQKQKKVQNLMQDMQARANSLNDNAQQWHVVEKRLARHARNYPFLHVLQGVCMLHIQQNKLKDKVLNEACMSCMKF